MAFNTPRPLKAIFQSDGEVILGEFNEDDVLEVASGGTGTTTLDQFRANLSAIKYEDFATFADFPASPESGRLAKDLSTGSLYYSHNNNWIEVGSSQIVSGTDVSGVAINDVEVEKLVFNGNLIFDYDSATKVGTLSVSATLTANELTIGLPTDGTYDDGAIGISDTAKTADVIDDLNEALDNIRNNTFVKSVSFTGNPLSGGEGLNVTLNITSDGNPNRYDIDWGDGSQTNGSSSSTPSHIYTSNTDSPYTITVKAFHNQGSGTGSEASHTREDYIIIYTANPAVAFRLYRNSSGGSHLTMNDLYVIEGNSLWMENLTTNTSMGDVTYSMDWGDGSTDDTIASDSAAGGVSGDRLQHTWAQGTESGTGRDTLRLTLDTHTTADPSVIPINNVLSLKVYDDDIDPPNGLNTKTITFTQDVGSSPRLAHGFTDNTGVTTQSDGDEVNRITSTSGTTESSEITSFAYNADSGALSAIVNEAADGSVTLTTGSNTGTHGSLVVTQESDYNLLNAEGATTIFNSSIYHPDLYKGFKAKVSKDSSTIPNGINSFKLTHTETGSTNKVEFVKDDLTSTPTVTNGTITEKTGTYKYISGIPYYDTGSSLTWSGIQITNFIGQTYRVTNSVIEVSSSTNLEGTSGSSIASENYSYSEVDNPPDSFLTGGIPNANTAKDTQYTIRDLTVNITSSSVRSVEKIKVRGLNVNGAGSYETNDMILQVHTANQTGINETSIPVSSSLGDGFNDNGVRIFNFASETTDNPSISNSINYYTNSLYTESSDPGVEGTQEATIRLGRLSHSVADYTSGYLPVGPDRSGDTGIQYFTFAFRRTVTANFNINISSGGISGIWIAAPGTTIDNSSTISGWLDCSVQYAGAGVPGEDTAAGGNGSNGCASTGSDKIQSNTTLSGFYRMTLGTENLTNATGNVALVRIALNTGQSVNSINIT